MTLYSASSSYCFLEYLSRIHKSTLEMRLVPCRRLDLRSRFALLIQPFFWRIRDLRSPRAGCDLLMVPFCVYNLLLLYYMTI